MFGKASSSTNPYAAPTADGPSGGVVQARTAGPAIAQLVRKGLLYRRIHVESPIEALVEYSGMGLYDRVWVNRELVIKRLPLVWLTEQFKFDLPTEIGVLPVELKLEFSRFARLIDVRLYVDDQLIYQEADKSSEDNEPVEPGDN